MENDIKVAVEVGVEPELHFRMSKTMDKFWPALIKAAAQINHAEKDADNKHFNNSYATITSIIDASKAALLAEQIIVIQLPSKTVLTTRLQHTSGEFLECDLELLYSKQDMQGLGSAITYGRRQSITAMLNMAQADDDGNRAAQEGKTKPSKTVIKTKADKSDDPFAG